MHFWAERVRTAMDQMSAGKKNSFLENAKDLVSNWIEINLIKFVKTLKSVTLALWDFKMLSICVLSVSKKKSFSIPFIKTGQWRNVIFWKRKTNTSPAFVRQENILTRLWHSSWHVPHDFTLLIVYFMSEIKLAPHNDAYWCRRAAELQYLTAIHVSDSKPGFGRKRTFIWTSRLQRCANAFVLNERSLVIFNLLGKMLLAGLFSLPKRVGRRVQPSIWNDHPHLLHSVNQFYAFAGEKGWNQQWRYLFCWRFHSSSRLSVLRCLTGDHVQNQMFNQASVSNRYKLYKLYHNSSHFNVH